MSLLQVEGLEASYGAVQALFGVDLTVGAGEVVALMGRNGMGKTTTIRAISGMMPVRAGVVQFAGQNIAPLPSHKIAQAGLGLCPEGRRCFAPLTVAENLVVAARPGPWDTARVVDLFPRLGERMAQRAGTLSGGEQQMLAIARALMTNPKLLVLDEATEGLAPVVRQEIWAAIRALKGADLSILLVDKSLKELRTVTDRAVILERGQSVWAGAISALSLQDMTRYLGV